MDFQISNINKKDKCIFIQSNDSFSEPDAFIHLLKSAASYLSSPTNIVGDCQYRISALNLDLVFQWDDLFGIVVVYKDDASLEKSVAILTKILDFAKK